MEPTGSVRLDRHAYCSLKAPLFFRFLDMAPPGVDLPYESESGAILLNGLPKDAPLCFRPTCRHAWAHYSIATTTRDSVPSLLDPRIAARLLLSEHTVHFGRYVFLIMVGDA